jgi:hypothetical protein
VSGKPKAKERLQRSDSRAGKEVLLLWAILGEGGGNEVSRSALNDKGMLPSDDRAARDGLKARGLIRAEKRTSRNEKGRSVSGYWMTVTETGRSWAEENLAAVPAKSQAATPILQAWLARLSIFLHARNIPMTEFLGQRRGVGREPRTERTITPAVPSHPSLSPPANDHDALRARIRQAYLELTGGRLNTRALLSDLREKLKDIDRPVLDEALKQMQREEEASLYQLDNQVEVTDADRAAAIYFGAEPRHILWIER